MAQETLEGKSEQVQPKTGDVIIPIPVNHGLASWGSIVGRVMAPQNFQYITFQGTMQI